MSSVPSLKAPIEIPHIDKVFHFCEYIPFGFLVTKALYGTTTRFSSRALFLLALGLTVFYAGTDEFHQSFVTGRNADGSDALFDVLGGLVGSRIYIRKRKLS